jgi:formylglycine-generating enzyme required for sulfatase activity/mono/diheme cytochrome c family protein
MTLHSRIFLAATAVAIPCFVDAQEAAKIGFNSHVKPILEGACIRCHNDDDAEGELSLSARKLAIEGGDTGAGLVPGNPNKSLLFTSLSLPKTDEMSMPPKGQFLAKNQIDVLRKWIEAGAAWPDDAEMKKKSRIIFARDIQPILEENCVSCHKEDNAEGDFVMTTLKQALTTGENAPNLIPFDAEKSAISFLTMLDADDEDLMPPKKKGGPLSETLTTKLRLWVEQGAPWPEGIVLKQKAKVEKSQSRDNFDLTQRIHAFIVESAKVANEAAMKNYTGTVPKTGIEYKMIALKGGSFKMGSPASETNRKEDEGPQVEVKISPFWMGQYEVTWNEYNPYMVTEVDRHKDGSRKDFDPATHKDIDAVSQPTTPYMEMSFGMGMRGFPAISMTQHAANKYCQWLSTQTGHFYRLPTEAEWEYACRAGTTTAFSFGDDAAKIGDYAVYFESSISKDTGENQYVLVGTKKPNPWGLYDMHGNVCEWVLDQYTPDGYAKLKDTPWIKPTTLYPRVVRGGGWFDDPESLRSAARLASSANWKTKDPQLPKSIWYHTDAKWLGFRIIRPLQVPSAEEMHEFWDLGRGDE